MPRIRNTATVGGKRHKTVISESLDESAETSNVNSNRASVDQLNKTPKRQKKIDLYE